MNQYEEDIRISVFHWLKEQTVMNGGVFDRKELIYGFAYQGQNITLIGPTGIWFPKGFRIPVSITTTTSGPYDDGFNSDGLLEYSYRGNDPNHRDNIGLKQAFIERTPLVYFHSIMPSKYVAVWPIFIIANDPNSLRVKAAIDPAYSDESFRNTQVSDIENNESLLGVRRYATSIVKQRLHQSAFREYVLDAYSRQCTMCRLQHPELLDAAHIIPDYDENGLPIIQNGLSLCKIHHAAYDKKIIGITPDYIIKVRDDVLVEQDGPMLRYGLQALNNNQIVLPKNRNDFPDRDRLDIRYKEFIA